jgi:hypothetical protein
MTNQEVQEILTEIKGDINNLQNQFLMYGKVANGEMKILTKSFEGLKKDTSEIKKTLLDPNTGIIVKVNKNTESREHKQTNDKQRDKIIEEFSRTCDEIKKWKDGVNKALWIIFAAIAGIIIKLIFGSF